MPAKWGLHRRSRGDAVPAPRHDASAPTAADTHRWIVGDQRAVVAYLSASAPPSLGVLPGHARLRGPFTAAGTHVRAVAPGLLAHCPDLTRGYREDMLAAAPDLAWLLGPSSKTGHLPYDHARRVAQALAELTLALARGRGPRQVLAVLDVDALDATDAAWLAVLLDHADPAYLELVLAGGSTAVAPVLAGALERHTFRVAVVAAQPAAATPPGDRALARAYVAGECLSDDLAQRDAYQRLTVPERAALHDARAARLELLGEPSLRLGAIPYHRERGSAPAAAVAALTYAITQCFRSGWYDATLDFGNRLRALLGTDDGGAFPLVAGA